MHKLVITKFGPLDACEISLQELNILIGPQSSGKSTLSKLFYFFLHLRDEFTNFLLDSSEENKPSTNIIRDFQKQIRKRFIEFWGPTPQGSDLKIKYYYSKEVFIEVKLDSKRHKYIDPYFSNAICEGLKKQLEILSLNKPVVESSNLFNNVTSIATEKSNTAKIARLIDSSKQLFNYHEELLFIPAGRSLLSTLSDQLQSIHPHQLDYPMRSFIERINKTKAIFGKSLDDIIKEKHLLSDKAVRFSQVNKVASIIKRILKGEYIQDKDGGKLYIDKDTYTKINFASSGQQESIWILLSLFLVVLDDVNAIIFIEEPEAHLFPVEQKDMVELISLIHNTTNTRFIITTHSPYILSAINNHIYANELAKYDSESVGNVIPQNLWLDYNNVAGYFVNNRSLQPLCDDELKMFKTELIDSASEIVNNEYDRLFEIEASKG